MSVQLVQTEVYYPETDGLPMGETDTHITQILDLLAVLREYFRNDPQVYVAADLLVYYEEGNPKRFIVPDVFVARGVPDRRRRVYKLWEEGQGPDVVFEISSESTMSEDLGAKKGLYAYLGVREYFLFDPLGEYLTPRLQSYQLVEGNYVRQRAEPLRSGILGLELRAEGGALSLYDPHSGRKLLTPAEQAAALQQAEAHATQEALARQQAEAEVARLREELERLKRGG